MYRAELWLPIPGYEGFYEVSDLGRVRSVQRQAVAPRGYRTVNSRVLKASFDKDGYPLVSISRGSKATVKTPRVHQLVLLAFKGPKLLFQEALHADGSKDNNVLRNLRYGTPTENWVDRKKHGRGIDGQRNPHQILKARRECTK